MLAHSSSGRYFLCSLILALSFICQVHAQPPACNTLTSDGCRLRSDCHFDIPTALCADGVGTGCGDYPLQSKIACTSPTNIHYCFWDLWYDRCFTSVSEASQLQQCSYWTNEPISPAEACTAHGCTWFNNQCYGMTVITDNNQTASLIYQSESVAWTDASFEQNTDYFGFHTLVPFTVTAAPASWWVFAIGNYTTGLPSNPFTLGPCTTLGQLGVNPIDVVFSDQAGLEADAVAWITMYGNVDFTTYPGGITIPAGRTIPTVEYKNALQARFGPFVTGNNQLVRSLAVSGATMDAFSFISLSAIRSCPGVVETVYDTYTYWEVPFGAYQMNSNGGLMANYHVFPLIQNRGGSMILAPSSTYQYVPVLERSIITQDPGRGCVGRNRADLIITYRVSVKGVMDLSRWIGPRSIQDFYIRPPYLAASAPVTNQYNEQFIPGSYTRLGCDALNTCAYTVQTISECRTLPDDGQGFNSALYADATNRIAAMHSDIPYPAGLDGQHNWYMDVYSCPIQVPYTADPPPGTYCENVNSTPKPEMVIVSLFQTAVPTADPLNTAYEVAAGFLPQPSSDISLAKLLIDQPSFNGLSNDPTTFNIVTNHNETRLVSIKQSLVPVVRLVDSLLHRVDLSLGIDRDNLTISALSSSGAPILDANGLPLILNFDQLLPIMEHVPKRAKKYLCPDCINLPTVRSTATTKGVDGFSIPGYQLYNAFSKPFEALSIKLTYYLGAMTDAAALATTRRLLQVSATMGTTVINPDNSFTFTYQVTVDWKDLPSYDPQLTYWNATSQTTIAVPITAGSTQQPTPDSLIAATIASSSVDYNLVTQVGCGVVVADLLMYIMGDLASKI